jgi:excisionase family DNA binding protein
MLEPELLDPATAARLLNIGRTTVYSMIARDLVPHVRIGRSVKIPRRALLEWIDDAAATGRRIDTRP